MIPKPDPDSEAARILDENIFDVEEDDCESEEDFIYYIENEAPF